LVSATRLIWLVGLALTMLISPFILPSTAPAALAAPPIKVDNSSGFGAIEGKLLDGRSELAVDNLNHFWVPIWAEKATGHVRLTPGPMGRGGIYVVAGVLGPDAEAVWNATFDPSVYDVQPITASASIWESVGGAAMALDLNALQIIADTLGGGAVKGVPSSILQAVNTVTSIPDFTNLVKDLTQGDLLSAAGDIANLASDHQKRAAVSKALGLLGIHLAESALAKITIILGVADALQTIWDEFRAAFTGGSFGQVSFSSTPPALKGALPPGGQWLAPTNGMGTVSPVLRLSARASPGSGSTVSHVDFTAWWPALGPQSGPWKTMCTVTAPSSGGAYGCETSLSQLGAPPGTVLISFNVYDADGNHANAPNGERSVLFAAPPNQFMTEIQTISIDLDPSEGETAGHIVSAAQAGVPFCQLYHEYSILADSQPCLPDWTSVSQADKRILSLNIGRILAFADTYQGSIADRKVVDVVGFHYNTDYPLGPTPDHAALNLYPPPGMPSPCYPARPVSPGSNWSDYSWPPSAACPVTAGLAKTVTVKLNSCINHARAAGGGDCNVPSVPFPVIPFQDAVWPRTWAITKQTASDATVEVRWQYPPNGTAGTAGPIFTVHEVNEHGTWLVDNVYCQGKPQDSIGGLGLQC